MGIVEGIIVLALLWAIFNPFDALRLTAGCLVSFILLLLLLALLVASGTHHPH